MGSTLQRYSLRIATDTELLDATKALSGHRVNLLGSPSVTAARHAYSEVAIPWANHHTAVPPTADTDEFRELDKQVAAARKALVAAMEDDLGAG